MTDLKPWPKRYALYFMARDGKSYKVVTTKAQGRNALGEMLYERPTAAFNRACQHIDLKKYTFHKHVETTN